MATNDFLPFGINASNISTQVDYAANPLRENGFTTRSEAPSALCNKVWRQSSMITSALAQAIMEVTGKDMRDQNYNTLVENIKSIIGTQNWIKCYPIGFAIEDNYEYIVTGFSINSSGYLTQENLGTGPQSSIPIYRDYIPFQYKVGNMLINESGYQDGDGSNRLTRSYVFPYTSSFYYYSNSPGITNYTIDLIVSSSTQFEGTNHLYKRKLLE